MPLIHRTVIPVKLSSAKLNLSKTDSEFFAVNNGSLVNILRQLSSLVTHAGDIFSQISIVAGEVGLRIQSIKLRLDELEARVELFDPKLVPVPEGTLDDEPISHQIRPLVQLHSQLFLTSSRPPFLIQLYEKTGKRIPQFPLRSPVLLTKSRHNANSLETNASSRRPASIAALRDWKLDDYVDEKLTTLERKKKSTPEELNQTVSGSFGPTQVVQVDVTGSGFDRMKSNRRSLTIHTKRIRSKKKRRNTICGAMPNKECGIQTSFSSVLAASDNNKKYGIDSGHWSSCTTSGVGGASSTSAPSPWDPNSITTSSDFLYDDEDRSLTPQLENFTDGLVSDSDCSVDSAGFFTSFRNDCGFPKSKKAIKDKEDSTNTPSTPATVTENEYELFGKGSTSTTASSCGTVVLRRKPDNVASGETSTEQQEKKGDDVGWEERVKRKSLIEVVPSMVVVTPSPSCSLNGGSPPPLKEPEHADIPFADEDDRSSEDRLTPRITESDSESGTLSDNDDLDGSRLRLMDSATPPAAPPDIPPREPHLLISSDASSSSSCSSNSNATVSGSSNNATKTEEQERSPCALPKPDVIPDVQQMQVIRTSTTPKLKSGTDYVSLDTVQQECKEQQNGNSSNSNESLDEMSAEVKLSNDSAHQRPGVSARIRGAKVVLDPNGEIIFSSETLKRKRRQKISFDPGASVKPAEYDSKNSYNRVRESIYDRLRPEKVDKEIYECIEKIRQHNLKESEAIEKKYDSLTPLNTVTAKGSSPSHNSSNNLSALPSPSMSMILETDLDNLPPVMPELETLPKIKDRLKRNESYRMANEELAMRPALSIHNRQFSGLNGHKSSAASAAAARKRDIPEEDPVFVQQILSLSSSTNSLSRNSPVPSSNHHSLFGRASSSASNHNTHSSNSSLILSPSPTSKFALTPDDRPSFLRRESPPSMDSITKEIYRFRKKFNIQPNASSASLLRPKAASPKEQKQNSTQEDLYAQILPKSSRQTLSTPSQKGKKVPPCTPLRSIFNYSGSPLSTSTPIRSTTVTSKPTQSNALLRQPFFGRKQVYSSLKQSGTQAFEDPKKDKTTKSVTFQFPKMAPGTPGIAENSTGVAGISYSSIKSPVPTIANYNPANHPKNRNVNGTSLNDFKKLLQATRFSSGAKRSPISAMEILKPKVGNNSSSCSSNSSSSSSSNSSNKSKSVETTL